MGKEIFEKELNYIISEDIKNFTEVALNNLPAYFYAAAASSTGRYHPKYALGEGGLVRHTKAAARFANHLLSLEQYQNQFSQRERDCIISAVVLHDGWKHGDKGSSFTTHEHPKVCADWIVDNELFCDIPDNDKRLIASSIASHMGFWNTSKRSSVVLDKPITPIQQFVHMCDYLASRKDIEVLFDEVQMEAKTKSAEPVDINTYVLTFGKHKGKMLTDVAKTDSSYIAWAKENMTREPMASLLKQL